MPLRHGSKIYCQLLLDTNRYKLAEKLAAAEGKKVTGLLREMVYAALEKALYNYMHGIGLDEDVRAWFDRKVPRTRVPRDFIDRALREKL